MLWLWLLLALALAVLALLVGWALWWVSDPPEPPRHRAAKTPDRP